jgi:hypothetical protein
MPYQNRVNPFGEIFRPESSQVRGLVMGNRGCLHDREKRIVRPFQVQRWIICKLEYKDWRRSEIMAAGKYTELFFLDEATALAAGHRPCALCSHERYQDFVEKWTHAFESSPDDRQPTAEQIDRVLHDQRIDSQRRKVTFPARLGDLPQGCFISFPGENISWLLWGNRLFKWAPSGYPESMPLPEGLEVQVLTPAATVQVLRAGYEPDLHPSAKLR